MIHVRDLEFRYGTHPLFSHLDMDIRGGAIHGLLGLNGAGKTTLLRLLSGQLFPSDGMIDVLGFTPSQRKPDFLSEIFFIPDEINLPDFTGIQYVEMISPFYPWFDAAVCDTLCKDFEVDQRRKLTELSFGQKKKFLLAFGLASMTPIMVMDEPTNGLDIPSKTQFRRAVAAAISPQRCFIISTHQVRDLENLIDPIIIVHNGKIIFNQSIEEISARFSMSHEYGQQPPTEVLYSEQIPGGWVSVHETPAGTDRQPLDLETLFNAVVANPVAFARQTQIQGGTL
ncbi:ABC transporter ATP-binding protein [Parasphaerochaeta coccoides]|uniref:ABC transporter related protein n=1 Tax=Parasphaerochaeta coccoides (strain ATCC BAA-1237 / DSM 17374 / SPN1) TaxID=760011 RepID=F4GJR3_PARC1|nr:ABC transporter ATP-binding protein [Parasphaerochaeta coccoides]AEC02810.1 ABC transporter related protein [Parasphaerochaeta coccoides DSM 17374]